MNTKLENAFRGASADYVKHVANKMFDRQSAAIAFDALDDEEDEDARYDYVSEHADSAVSYYNDAYQLAIGSQEYVNQAEDLGGPSSWFAFGSETTNNLASGLAVMALRQSAMEDLSDMEGKSRSSRKIPKLSNKEDTYLLKLRKAYRELVQYAADYVYSEDEPEYLEESLDDFITTLNEHQCLCLLWVCDDENAFFEADGYANSGAKDVKSFLREVAFYALVADIHSKAGE